MLWLGRIGLLWLCFAAAAPAADPVDIGDKPSVVERLIATVPVLSSDDKSLKSFELIGVMPSQASFHPVRMEFSWEREGQLSELLTSPSDGAPIIWAAQERVAIYDPTQERLSVFEAQRPTINVKGTPRRLEVSNAIHSKSQSTSQLVDLRSMFTAQGDDWEVQRTKAGWRLSQLSRSGKTRISGTFSDGDEPAFLTMQVVMTDRSETRLFSVESLRINRPLRSRISEFPDNLVEVPHSDVAIQSAWDMPTGMGLISRAIIVNVGLHTPSVRNNPKLDLLMMDDVDWDMAQRQHARMLPKLQSLLHRHFAAGKYPPRSQ